MSEELLAQAAELEREAALLEEVIRQRREEAAKLRARVENDADPLNRVRVSRYANFTKVRDDALMPSATLAVEEFPGPFTARDLAVKLAITDVDRALRLILGLSDLDKVERWGDGWICDDGCDPEVRDYAVEAKAFTMGDAIIALKMPEMVVADALERLCDRGILTNIGGEYEYVEPDKRKVERIRRRPPEQDPPAFSEAVARGKPIRLLDHGKRAKLGSKPGQAHKLKMRDKRYEEMQAAKEARQAEAKAKMEAQMAAGGTRRRK